MMKNNRSNDCVIISEVPVEKQAIPSKVFGSLKGNKEDDEGEEEAD